MGPQPEKSLSVDTATLSDFLLHPPSQNRGSAAGIARRIATNHITHIERFCHFTVEELSLHAIGTLPIFHNLLFTLPQKYPHVGNMPPTSIVNVFLSIYNHNYILSLYWKNGRNCDCFFSTNLITISLICKYAKPKFCDAIILTSHICVVYSVDLWRIWGCDTLFMVARLSVAVGGGSVVRLWWRGRWGGSVAVGDDMGCVAIGISGMGGWSCCCVVVGASKCE